MLPITKALTSSIGKKYLMAASGLALLGFIVMHLAGNLTLYAPDGAMFNAYAKGLHDLGPLLYLAEIGLGAAFLLHAAVGIALHLKTREARGKGYEAGQTSKEGASKYGLAANNMIITGVVLFVFLILHILHFKFGAGVDQGYETVINGEPARDLYRLVAEEFAKPLISIPYMLVMVFLGLHLRHGFWSWFQSLGAMAPKYTKAIYAAGLVFAVAIALGFLGIPLWFLLDGPGLLK